MGDQRLARSTRRNGARILGIGAMLLLAVSPAVAQVSVGPAAPALRLLCVSTTGVLSFDGNSNTTCSGAQTNLTSITVNNGGGFVASGSAGFSATGTGGVSTASGNIATSSGNITAGSGNIVATGGNITATSGTVQGATLTDGTVTITGGNISGVGTLTASIGNIGTVNSTTIVNSGSTTAR